MRKQKKVYDFINGLHNNCPTDGNIGDGVVRVAYSQLKYHSETV